jgi:hypothetical protein
MFSRFGSFIPESVKEKAAAFGEKAAAFGEKAKAGAAAAAEDVKRRTAVVRDVAVGKYDAYQNKKENLSRGITFNYITPTLTANNFKKEIGNLKEKLVIELKNRYGIVNPTFDCLIRFSPSIKVYKRDPTIDPARMALGRSRDWIKMDVYAFFYKQFGLSTFDEFQTKVKDKDFEDFKVRLTWGKYMKDVQLKVELADTFDAERKNEYSICKPQSGGRSRRRRSSRKNYRKSVRSVKRAARSRSGSGTRKYRNRS